MKNSTKTAARAAMKNRTRSPTKYSMDMICPMNSPLKNEMKGSRNSQVEVTELALKYDSLKERFMKDAVNPSKME